MHAGSTGVAPEEGLVGSTSNIGTLLAKIPPHIHPLNGQPHAPLSPQPDRKKFSGKFPQPLTYAKQIYKYIFIIKPDERLALAARRRARV